MSENKVCPEKLAAFDKRAAAAKAATDFDYNKTLQLETLSPEQQETAAREFRLRGIDSIITELKQKLPKDEVTALNRYLRSCPRIDELATHIMEYTESQALLKEYLPKLHKRIQ